MGVRARAVHPGRRPVQLQHLQPGVHAARRHHGVPRAAVPAIPATMGNFFLPLQLGTIDVAFPKLNLASFHIYVLGAVFLVRR